MDDFVQIALDPAVTVTVIACLTLVIILQHLDGRRRMRDLTKRLGRMTGTLLAAAVNSSRIVEQAKVRRAIELTIQLKEMNPDLTLDELLFGTVPQDKPFPDLKDPHFRSRSHARSSRLSESPLGGSGITRSTRLTLRSRAKPAPATTSRRSRIRFGGSKPRNLERPGRHGSGAVSFFTSRNRAR